MEDMGQHPAYRGETPDIGEGFSRQVLRSVVRQARKFKSSNNPDHVVGLRLHHLTEDGRIEQIWDGELRDYAFSRDKDQRLMVKLKDSAAKELQEHPLRDGVVLGVGALMLLGGGFYARHKRKKQP